MNMTYILIDTTEFISTADLSGFNSFDFIYITDAAIYNNNNVDFTVKIPVDEEVMTENLNIIKAMDPQQTLFHNDGWAAYVSLIMGDLISLRIVKHGTYKKPEIAFHKYEGHKKYGRPANEKQQL